MKYVFLQNPHASMRSFCSKQNWKFHYIINYNAYRLIIKYNDGFLVRYPSRKDPNCITPYEENKKLHATLKEYDDINSILGISTLYDINQKIRNGEGSVEI